MLGRGWKEIKEVKRKNGPLRHSRMASELWRNGPLEEADSRTTSKIGFHPAYNVGVERGV
jgi:hypothetical protein